MGSSKFSFSYYITGFLILLGVLLGRFICGFLCPFGWLQELLHKIPSKKFCTKKLKPLTYVKYVVLVLTVILLPILVVNDLGMGDPFFCKYICPQGVLEGAIPLSIADENLRAALGDLFTWKLFVLIAVVVLSVLIFHPFCKWICPLGAFYGLMNKVSLLGIKVDQHKCVSCVKCAKACKMDVDIRKSPNHTECIRCGKCISACPVDAIDDAKDKLTDEETETLKSGAQQIKEIEDQLAALEQDYPECGSTPGEGEGESVEAASAGMVSDSSEQTAFPSFTGKDFDGNDVSSDELFSKNKVTVVNFWFSTCKPCVEELGDLDALNKELAEKGGEIVGVNSYTLDGDETAISDAKGILSKKGATYRNIWFGSETEAGQFTAALFSFPTTYVVDQNGNIVGQPIMGGITSAEQKEALNKLIDQALANSEE